MVEENKEEAKIELKKMKLVIDFGNFGAKPAVDILRDAITEDKNWKHIWDETEKYKEEDDDGYYELKCEMEKIQGCGDLLLDHDPTGYGANQDDFDSLIRGMEEWEANDWLRMIHRLEFIVFTPEFMEKCNRE